MNREEAIEIVKNTFHHLIFEENVKVGTMNVPLYFPTVGIAILECSGRYSKCNSENVQSLNEHLIKKELNAIPIYLDMEQEDFCIGFVINEMLLEGRFLPGIMDIDEKERM